VPLGVRACFRELRNFFDRRAPAGLAAGYGRPWRETRIRSHEHVVTALCSCEWISGSRNRAQRGCQPTGKVPPYVFRF
jgi:hypothetical protein